MKRSSPIDYNTIFSPATVLKSFGSAVDGTLPLDGSGLRAMVVRVTATAAGFVRMSSSQAPVTATKNDTLIQPGDFLLMRTAGMDYVSFISDSASATCTISPQEWGGYVTGTVVVQFSPAMLFTAGVTGAWYDPSDINLTWRRNLLTYSEQFDNAAWFKNNWSVSTNSSVAPDGSMTADKMVENTVNGFHATYYTQSLGTVTGTYSYSVYLKNAGRSWANIRFNGVSTWFDITNGAIGTIGSGVTASISSAGNGWYRCTVSAIVMSVAISPEVIMTTGDLAGVYTGDGTSGIYIWGAQLEVGSTATPYQRITDGIQDYLSYQAQPVLYRDAAGTTPVTGVEQPVGLMLDKSKGLVLGPDVKPTSGSWTPEGSTVATSNSPVSVTFNASPNGDVYASANGVPVGSYVELTYTVSNYSSGAVCVQYGYGAALSYVSANGTYTKRVLAIGNGAFYVFCSAGTTATVTINSARIVLGNHAFNSSGNSANFPVLSARYNLLTKTEDFSDAAWATLGTVTRTPNYAVAPDGTTTAQRVVFSQNSSSDQFFQVVSVTSTTYSQGVWIKVPSGSALIKFGFYDGAIKTSALTLTTTWQYFTATQLLTAGAGARLMWLYPDGAGYATEIYVWHPDIRVANDGVNLPAYQRVNTATDYDTVGFKPYLRFNGTNQWLQTNSIDFTYGDKMFVCAGVRKLSDAASGHLVELSATIDSNNGSFVLAAPSTPNHYVWGSKGTIAKFSIVSSGYSAPITNVISGIGNISGDQAILRANGTQVAIASPGQGTGNYGNYPLYIGARAGTSLWFNGRLYGMVVAGKQASAAEITSTETYINQKTGAY